MCMKRHSVKKLLVRELIDRKFNLKVSNLKINKPLHVFIKIFIEVR